MAMDGKKCSQCAAVQSYYFSTHRQRHIYGNGSKAHPESSNDVVTRAMNARVRGVHRLVLSLSENKFTGSS